MCIKDFILDTDYDVRARGIDYYESGRVLELTKTKKNSWKATIMGSRKYTAKVTIDGEEVTAWSCSCPYDGHVCKHVIAMCLTIEDEMKDLASGIAPKVKDPDRTSSIIDAMKPDELKKELLAQLNQNKHQKEAFILKNICRIKIDYTEVVKQLCKTATHSKQLQANCLKLLSSMDDILAKGRIEDAWELMRSLIEIAAQQIDDMEYEEEDADCFADFDADDGYDLDFDDDDDDDDDDESDLYSSFLAELAPYCFKVISSANDKLKRQIFSWALLYIRGEIDYGLDTILKMLHLSIVDGEMGEKFLAELNRIISARDTMDLHEIKPALDQKISYLKSLGRQEEAWQVVLDYQDFHDFRVLLIKSLMNAKQFDQAAELCVKYLEQNKYKGYGVTDLVRLRIRIADEQKDLSAQIHFTTVLYYTDGQKIEHYKALKALCPPEVWTKVKAETEKVLLQAGYQEDNLAQIYVVNDEPDKMLNLLFRQKGLSSLFRKYGKFAAQADMAKFKFIYRDKICAQLVNTGRGFYEDAASHLECLLSISEDTDYVRDLILQLKKKYSNRRAMIEIFNRVFPKL